MSSISTPSRRWRLPDPAKRHAVYHAMDLTFRLKPGGKAVDAGDPIPTVNDGFAGAAPDLGALEVGQPEPHYGPRWLKGSRSIGEGWRCYDDQDIFLLLPALLLFLVLSNSLQDFLCFVFLFSQWFGWKGPGRLVCSGLRWFLDFGGCAWQGLFGSSGVPDLLVRFLRWRRRGAGAAFLSLEC